MSARQAQLHPIIPRLPVSRRRPRVNPRQRIQRNGAAQARGGGGGRYGADRPAERVGEGVGHLLRAEPDREVRLLLLEAHCGRAGSRQRPPDKEHHLQFTAVFVRLKA